MGANYRDGGAHDDRAVTTSRSGRVLLKNLTFRFVQRGNIPMVMSKETDRNASTERLTGWASAQTAQSPALNNWDCQQTAIVSTWKTSG